MSRWPSAKARRVLAALVRIGWSIKRQAGSHRTLERAGFPDYVFAFHDNVEIGPRMLTRIAEYWVEAGRFMNVVLAIHRFPVASRNFCEQFTATVA